ncbi:MAG: hypothetical protein J7K88_04360 [Candidatus Fermentibacteraceae bacterium]|nr:hypothetical protein [Candidatus Fermentibacteraceae bacterium]
MKYAVKILPLSKEDFSTLLPDLHRTPEGAAAACIFALNILAENSAAGIEALKEMNPDVTFSTLQLAESQLKSKPYMIHSYFTGTAASNGYRLPENLEFDFTTNRYSGTPDQGRVKLFVACTGAHSPRPITVRKRNDGSWYALEWSSLVVGIKPPPRSTAE